MYEQSPFTGPLARCSIPRGPCPRSRSLRSRERWESAVPRGRYRSPIDESDRFPSAIAVSGFIDLSDRYDISLMIDESD